jgi:hypothetical protein
MTIWRATSLFSEGPQAREATILAVLQTLGAIF